MAPVYNWGGIYFGANGGYGFGNSKQNPPPPLRRTGTFGVTGFMTGGTIGPISRPTLFVFGIQGDFDGLMDAGLRRASGLRSGWRLPAMRDENSRLCTVRDRVRYAADRVLFYGTAGGARQYRKGANGATNSFAGASKAGWTAGAGVEVAFADNWTARIEYLFVDLENASVGTPTTTVTFDASMVRLGVDYKFR